MSSAAVSASAVTLGLADSQAQPQPKYVPLHRRTPPSNDTASRRSPSPTPSDASTDTLVASEPPSTKPRVYSIDTLLHLAQDPEIKLISLVQKDRLREVVPEIVMNRKTRKAMEYHAIQERVRAKAHSRDVAETQLKTAHDLHSHLTSDAPVKLPQRPGMRRNGRPGAERRRNVNKALDDVSWRTVRIPSVTAV